MLCLSDPSQAILDDLPEEALAAYLEARMEREANPPFARLRQLKGAMMLDPMDSATLCGAIETQLGGQSSQSFGPDDGVLAVAPALLRDADPLSVVLPKTRPTAPGPDVAAEIAVIDAGIAFWNPGFLEMEICSVSHLARGPHGEVEQLSRVEIDAAIARGATQEGDRINRLMLAAAFPGSVHSNAPGRAPLVRPGRPAHGTAMLDALGRTAPHGSRVHCLELPRTVLRDSTGIRMRTILPLAIASVAAAAAQAATPGAQLRLVILLAYGFPGGPQTGTDPAFLRAVTDVIDALALRNIAVELVLPTGNHLQGQGVAKLPAPTLGTRAPLNWRTLPGDHSNNRLEIFHAPGTPSLEISAPDGATMTRAQGDNFAFIRSGAHIVGLVYTQAVSQTVSRTEVILSGSAARRGRPGAPFGAWRLVLGGDGAATAYVRRDDSGFEDDRAAPFRPSWLEDPAYRARNAMGLPGVDDADHPDSTVQRAGSISVLCTGGDARLRTAGALWSGGGATAHAIYAGLPSDPADAPDTNVLVDGPGPFIGMPLRGDGSIRKFRLSGTSVAAALKAGEWAAGQSPTSPSA